MVDPGTSEGYLRDVEAPWFAYWLKDKGTLSVPDAYLYDAGARQWRAFDAWPPEGRRAPRASTCRPAASSRSTRPPRASEPTTSTSPIRRTRCPTARGRSSRPTTPRGSRWRMWETEDQRFVDGRPDVLTWVSEPLGEDLTIAGDVTAQLVASTTGRDADWVVKLIDVFPDSVPDDWKLGGYELMVAHEIMRGRYRKSFSAPAPLAPNTPLDFTVDLHQQSYTFKRGHQLMVQVQSTWFPLYDRNPQTWVPNIFKAKATDFQAETHRVWHTAEHPSRVEVTVVPASP